MPFGRLHEEAAGEDKLLIISDAAWRMWGMGLIYCQKNLTDGFIDERAIELWGVKAKPWRRVADELCREQVKGRAPLWERVDGGYKVHDYLQWNDSKEEILQARQGAKDRIARFRERQRQEREDLERRVREAELAGVTGVRNALQPAEQNAEHHGEQHAHDVVRGTDLKEDRVARFPRAHHGAGVLTGALQRDHLKHVACDPTYSRCVPEAVHGKLLNKLAPKHGGDRNAAGAALKAWYPEVWATLPEDFVVGDEFKFWQGRFDAAFASPDPTAGKRAHEPKSTVPSVSRTQEYLRQQRQG
jgi:hypothetical protein